jgi:dihydroflavonol-4-reductase
MRYLVTGATGFVGANVVRHLLSRGDKVVCLVRESSPDTTLRGLGVERAVVDLNSIDELAASMDGIDGVFHLAGSFDPSQGGGERMKFIHETATQNLCEAAVVSGVKRFVLCSSSVTIGFGDLNNPGDESQMVANLDTIYGKTGPLRQYHDTKLNSEAIAFSFCDRGLEAVVVNPDFVVGAWDLKPTSGAMIVTMSKRWVPVYPKGGKCFIDADDCADAHIAAMDRGRPGERYLLGVWNLTYREFMTEIAGVVGQRPPKFPVPKRALSVAGLLGGLAARVNPHGAAGLEPNVLRSMNQLRYRSGKKAIRELGLRSTPITESISKAHDWFLTHGYLD